ncbi:restriction endonuclease [Pedobacter sp. D749]|uniref:nSTAND3 domain-containing NTPase n=1 Tax=Pedobacter sp. D749 TaxID=2856523 RepID=UPI001C575FCE|nr:restriction endonuclease [Pedobacter sp. D749]QXU43814.1 restriction endonuclease [Pedobacter sp. D749]
MPNQYTFNDFDPREFEFLCRDLLQLTISEETGRPFLFNSFSEGADGGIDAIFEDEKEKIVLQCKRWSDFDALYATLKNSELPKVIRLNPTRYIIATSCKLSQRQMEKIYTLFKPYVHSTNDILGQAMINNLLALYPDVELSYPRLYLHSATVLNRLLQANVYNQSVDKLKKYHKVSRFYVPDASFQQALKILNDKRYVIISGEPGVGKSTLAGILSLYYLEQGYEFIFLRRSISEAEGSVWNAQKKQVFFFDDFLGSTTFEGFDRNEDRQLLDFISKIVDSSNKLLLITTREYVFKQAEAIYPELKKLHFTKCLIRQKEFTPAFKINILYNYLYYSKVELKHIEPLLYDEHYKEIIHHNNFTPRLIDDYLDRYYNLYADSYSLYFGLKKYLDDPYSYWETIFLKLSENAQILLLIMAITEEPSIEALLFKTFINVGLHRKIYEQGYEQDRFDQAVAELAESFISISHNPEIKRGDGSISSMDYSLIFTAFRTDNFFEFQNPSIKDFTVNYLRKREDLVAFMIRGATLFNQLYFVFATSKEDKHIEDYDTDTPFSIGKIILSPSLCALMAEKMISEFDTLPIAKVKRIDWEGGDTSFHLDNDQFDNRMDKLWLLCRYFPLANHETVLRFVKEKYEQLLEEDKFAKQAMTSGSNYRALSLAERITQTDIIKKLQPFVSFDPLATVKAYYHNLRFAKEFFGLHYLQEIFPDAYYEVVTTNIKDIRRWIKGMIYDDIDYYLWEGTHEAELAIDELVDEELEHLEEIYKFKLSKKTKQDINDMAGRELFRINKLKKNADNLVYEPEEDLAEETPRAKQLDKQKYKAYQLALNRLKPNWAEDWEEEEDAFRYIRSTANDPAAAEHLIGRIANHKHYQDLLDNTRNTDLLLNYLIVHKEDVLNEYAFYECLLLSDSWKEEQLTTLQAVAYNLYINELFTFRQNTFESALSKVALIPVEQYRTILQQQDIWFRFPNTTFHIFLSVRYMINLPEQERSELYRSFKDDDDCVHYDNREILWRLCYEADKDLFCAHFIVPVIQSELNIIFNKYEDEMTIQYLEKNSLDYEFGFWKEAQQFEIDRAGGGNALLDDIARVFEEWNIPDPFWSIGDCFNISYIENTAVIKYMQQHCPVTDGQYKIDLTDELKNATFRKLLKPAGVTRIIVDYTVAWSKVLLELQ